MSGSFSGNISTDNTEPLSIQHTPLPQDDIDPRINIVKEYLLKAPNAMEKDLKKALTHFSKATDDEFKEIIKSANIDKYNELFPQIQSEHTDMMIPNNRNTPEEIAFLEQYRLSNYKRGKIFELYKLQFPNSTRKIQFLSDYYYNQKSTTKKQVTKKSVSVNHVINNQGSHNIQNNHILAQAIESLYKSGKSPKMFSQIKPVIELINDPDKIEFAIECLTS